MTDRVPSTIAQVLYPNELELDFARIVSELETVLTRLGGCDAQLHWDTEDLVTFDLPEAHILLATAEFGRSSQGNCLTVSVGPSTTPQDGETPAAPDRFSALSALGGMDHATLCSRLVERVQGRFVPAAILWQEIEALVDSDLVESLNAELPNLRVVPKDGAPATDRSAPRQRASVKAPALVHTSDQAPAPQAPRPAVAAPVLAAPIAAVPAAPMTAAPPKRAGMGLFASGAQKHAEALPSVANDVPDLPLPQDQALQRLRGALYPAAEEVEEEQRPSTQIRLAAHCLNATLILVYAPLGAAVMTYALLKGEDIRFSARMMAVVGTVVGLAQTPLGQTVKAMASVRGWH